MLLHGIFPPITTPFYPNGEVYYKKLESNVERYSRTPVAGIVVQGSTTAPLTEWLRLKINPANPAVFTWERNPR